MHYVLIGAPRTPLYIKPQSTNTFLFYFDVVCYAEHNSDVYAV